MMQMQINLAIISQNNFISQIIHFISYIDLIVHYISMIDFELITLKIISSTSKKSIKCMRMLIIRIIRQILRTLSRKKKKIRLCHQIEILIKIIKTSSILIMLQNYSS